MPVAQPEDLTHVARFHIKVEGADAPLRAMEDLLDCTVENSLHLPDMCTIRLADRAFHWLDADTFKEGKKIQVDGGGETGALTPLFWGEVTSLEMDLAAHGVPTLVVRCLSRAHRLHRGRYARSYVQVKDSDIAGKIAGEVGFSARVDPTSQVYDWVFQNNQTNWEFLSERAARNGYRLYVSGERDLHFEKVSDAPSDTVSITWGENLRSFRPRVSAAPQVDEVMVRGWDPKTKRAIVGTAKKASGVPEVSGGADGGKVAQGAFGAARMVVVDRPVTSQAEAEVMAQSLIDEIGGEYLEAEGLCYGLPRLKPGVAVDIKNIGSRFSGKYFVTATTHTYSPAEGYTTQFSVSGKRPHTILSLLEGEGWDSRRAQGHAPLGGNIVVAIVTDNKDPDDLGRVKVKYPWLTEEHTSFWARIASPMAGPNRGFYFLPEIDDEVLVAFEHGDIHRPYLLGQLWNGKDKPVEPNSKAVQDARVQRRTIKTRIGHEVLLDDTDGKGEMTLTTCNGHSLTLNDAKKMIQAQTTGGHSLLMDDDGQKVSVTTTSGHNVLMDDSGMKIVVVDKTGSNKLTIDSSDNSMKMECMGNFTVESQGQVAIHGQMGVEIKTPMQMQIEGQMGVGVKTNMQLDLEASMQASLKGSAMVEIQGGLVKIN